MTSPCAVFQLPMFIFMFSERENTVLGMTIVNRIVAVGLQMLTVAQFNP